MNTEQERVDFEAWAIKERIAYRDEKHGVCFYNGQRDSYWIGYQAGRAALQSQDREDAERYRWLRQMIFDSRIIVAPDRMLHGEALDHAIDHARRVEGES